MTKRQRCAAVPLIAMFLAAMSPPPAHPEDGNDRGLDRGTIADSVAEFSGGQGDDNWYYGYYDGDGPVPYSTEDFERFPLFDGSWSSGSLDYWTAISAYGGHPNGQVTSGGRKPEQHWAVRRWVSEAAGTVTITGRLAKQDPGSQGDGVDGHILVDGETVWSQHVREDDTVGVEYAVDVSVRIGSIVDFALDPGGNDWQDTTRFTARVAVRAPLGLGEQLSEFINETTAGLASCEAGTVAFSGFVGGEDEAPALGERLDGLMISAVRELPRFHLIDMDALAQALETAERTRSDLRDTFAAIEIGRMLGADYMVTGTIVAMERSAVLFARTIDIAAETVVNTSQTTLITHNSL